MKNLIAIALIFAIATGQLFINEIDYDQPGTDSSEFIELAGYAGTYNNVMVQLINGNNGEPYPPVYDLGTVTLLDENAGFGFFVIGATTVPNVDFSDGFPATNAIQNGSPDGAELWVDGVLVQAVSYEGEMNDSQGNLMEMAIDGSNTYPESEPDMSLGRIGPDGFPWEVSTTSPGTINDGQILDDDVNIPPTADAGTDQYVLSGDLVTLDGSNSVDLDGEIVYWQWSQIGGTPVILSDSEAPIVTFTAPISAEPLSFELTVYDDLYDSDTDVTNVVVCAGVTIAEARLMDVGSCAAVEAIVTSPNFQSTNTEHTIQDETAGVVLFIYGTDLILEVGQEVQVVGMLDEFNGKFEIVPESLDQVTVLGTGQLPEPQVITVNDLSFNGEEYESELITINNVSVIEGSWPNDGYSVNLTITDDGNSTVTMRVDSDTDLDGSPEPVWPANVTGVGGQYYTYQLLPRFISDFQETGGNQLPIADGGGDQMVDPGVLVTLDGSASYDPDGLVVGYIWEQLDGPNVLLSDYEEPVVTFTAPDVDFATLTFRLTVVDNEGAVGSVQVSIIVVGNPLDIPTVQYTADPGSGDDCYPSPYAGETVVVTGVVTGVHPGTYPNFFMQTPEVDSWAGVYVYDTTVAPEVGDEVLIVVGVQEYYGYTELSGVQAHVNIGPSGTPITPIDISTADLAGGCSATGEPLEGMLVRVSNVVVTQAASEYGEWYVDDGSGACQIDDYMFDGDSPSPEVGDEFGTIVGVVDYSYDEYGILPRGVEDLATEMSEVSISDIQLSTDMGNDDDCYPSPLEGQTVQVSGVVTAVRADETYPSFYIQDPDVVEFAGLYIYVDEGYPMMTVGNEVTVVGSVSEYFGFTELTPISDPIIDGMDEIAPLNISTVELAGGCTASGEILEGMLVTVSNVTVTQAVDEFGQWYVDDGSGACQIDDYMFDGEMESPPVGSMVAGITGVVNYYYEEFTILPRNADDINLDACQGDGDINADLNTDILDVVGIVGYILNTLEFDANQVCHADANTDGSVDILDVVLIVGWILGTRDAESATQATLKINSEGILLQADGLVDGIQLTLTHDSAIQLQLNDDAYLAESSTIGNVTRILIVHPDRHLFSIAGDYTVSDALVVAGNEYIAVDIAESFSLLSNHPNPFNPQTTLVYELADDSPVTLKVFDLLGNEVVQLVDQVQQSGYQYRVNWDGLDSQYRPVPSGIYLVRLETSQESILHKITLLR